MAVYSDSYILLCMYILWTVVHMIHIDGVIYYTLMSLLRLDVRERKSIYPLVLIIPSILLFTCENSFDCCIGYAEDTIDPSVIMMASSICSLILDSTSEEALLRNPDFNTDNLITLSQLMKRSLVTCSQVISMVPLFSLSL